MKIRVRDSQIEQYDILNSWDLMHIMRQIDRKSQQKRDAQMQKQKSTRSIEERIVFHS